MMAALRTVRLGQIYYHFFSYIGLGTKLGTEPPQVLQRGENTIFLHL